MGNAQKSLLTLIISKCREGRLIISEKELQLKASFFKDKSAFLGALRKLEREEYIQVIYTDRHGEPYLYIILLKRANFYFYEKRAQKKEVLFKLILAVVSALITFILGRILYTVFS